MQTKKKLSVVGFEMGVAHVVLTTNLKSNALTTAPQRRISVTGANFDNYLQNLDIRAQGTITHYSSEKIERKTTKSTFQCFGIRQPRKNQRFGHFNRTYFNEQRRKISGFTAETFLNK